MIHVSAPTVGGEWTWAPDGSRRIIADTNRYESFPSAVRLSSGRIVTAWGSQIDHYSPDKGKVSWSDDDGVTWPVSVTLSDGATALAALGNRVAALIITTGPRTGWVRLSSDGGETWGASKKVTWASTGWIFPADLIWHDDGTPDGLLLATSYGEDGILIAASADAGTTWTHRAQPYPVGMWQEATEPTLCVASNGDLVMLVRNDTTRNIDMCRSADMGVTWTAPVTVMIAASGLPRMTNMGGGTILATLRDEGALPDGGWALGLSRDDGHTWSKTRINDEWMMYGQVVQITPDQALLVAGSQDRGNVNNADVWSTRLSFGRVGGVNAIDHYLAQPVVDARLELTSILGGEVLAELKPRAGTITWDTTDRRGRLDVDTIAESVMHARHPLANLGQVLQAWWHWPELGIRVPCGTWLVSEPAARTHQIWQVSADPEGPARLARAKWWTPGGTVISGTMAAQVARMTAEARVQWVPSGSFGDHSAPATECTNSDTILASIQKVLDHADAELRPDRHTPAVVLARRRVHATDTPDWVWSDQGPRIHKVTGAHPTQEIPNRVTVWFEADADGERTVKGWSEPLFDGPRRWDGPYGRVPIDIKLDGEATQADMRTQAKRELAQAQVRAATVTITMVADPRVEVGDTAHVLSPTDHTDCFGRVVSVELDAGTGLATVEVAVLTGTVAGTPMTYTDLIEGA